MMKNKIEKQSITNEEKYKRIKLRLVLWYLIIIFGLATITLSIFSLFMNLNPIYPLICFLIEALITRWRNSIDIDGNDKNKKEA